ncbi:V-type proton ATPase subunit S1b [Brachionichthys hirsutus]|uniref:V-type proton ATPase subunit S1b n=1 Tax=Brachionichthys hirsutus TaxID=412623 RepID=UPI0036044CFF
MAGPRCGSPKRSTVFTVFFLAFVAPGSGTAQVPVLMWSSGRLPPASPAAGHITSHDQLAAYLHSAFGSAPHTVLLFLQDKLSKDDFTVFGGVYGDQQGGAFQNLQAALRSSSSSVTLPSLAWSGSASVPSLLQETLGVPPVRVDAAALSRLALNASVSNLLLVGLPYGAGAQTSLGEVLHANDVIIGEVLRAAALKGLPFSAVLTGLRPSRVIPEASVPRRPGGRALLQLDQSEDRPPITYNSCIMLWARRLAVSPSRAAPWIDLRNQTASLDGSVCNGTRSRLVLNYASGYLLSFDMTQRFYPVSGRRWFTLDTVQLQTNGDAVTFSGGRGIYAPAEYSFHCESVTSFRDALLVPSGSAQNSSEWRLEFTDFQIQGFGLDNGTRFSYASDCAGFFTPGVWMALLTSLLLLLVLVFGLHMILQLNTMDRFDDPKGAAISVPQTE